MTISLLFLTYENPLHTNEWENYISNEKINIIIHPKYPKKINNIWKPFIASKLVSTEWGSDSIIIATLILLKQALDSYNSDWYILCSEDSHPLVHPINCLEYFNNKELSIFHPIDENNPNKTSQWFALSKTDVIAIVNNLRIDQNYNIQNKQLYNSIINDIPSKSAVDELFFIPLLKTIDVNYNYDVGLIHYVKWIPGWVSKHPTIFNRLLISDENAIRANNPLFIRKTFSTFKYITIIPKPNAIIITIGSGNIGKINYDDFLDKIKYTHDLYLLLMVDDIQNLSSRLKSQCVQAYSVVWKMVEQAHSKIASINKSIKPHYDEVIIFKENDDPNELLQNFSQSSSSSDSPQINIIRSSPTMPPPNFNNLISKSPPPIITNKINNKSSSSSSSNSSDSPPISKSKLFKPVSSRTMKSIEYNPNYKIAYLFLLRADINHPNIWSRYFVEDSMPNISRYVHSKEKDNIKTPWIRNSLIEDIKPTGWGYIVDAYFSLFREALKDPNNLKFVLVSESCVPVKNFYEFKDYLDNTDYRNSYVHFLRVTSYDQQERIENQPNYQEFGTFTKHYARMCLSRYHVEKLLEQSQDRINFFINMHVGDEFFMTLLNAKPNQDYILNKTITYDNWEDVQEQVDELKSQIRNLGTGDSETKYKLEDKMNDIRKNPKTYNQITKKDIDTVFSSGAFFWRKFPESLSLGPYYDSYGALKYSTKKGGNKECKSKKSKKIYKNKTKKVEKYIKNKTKK